ncbi:MAG: DUF72 domain-containing protein [Actinomycetota bacterium]|nr:DUF72 domain-containing protein [Actinomycetota bacterium]
MARTYVGISGWTYKGWRGVFYPPKLPHRRELEYAAQRMNSVELNGSFYSLQRPSSYRSWFAQTPEDFVFSVKGPRFITHMKKLRDIDAPLSNFLASGVLALGHKLGPLLWQLPPNLGFDAGRLADFFSRLPRTTAHAAVIAERHEERLQDRAWTVTDADRPLRHALEVRHASYETLAFVDLLREYDVALVTADTAGKWPFLEDLTSDFVYVRLHGDEELYVSGYSEESLDAWAAKVLPWSRGEDPATARRVAPPSPPRSGGRDVFVYFDNDVKVRAPYDAMSLARRVGAVPPT